jgi:hypothetical protein
MKEFVITAKRDAKWQNNSIDLINFSLAIQPTPNRARILNPGVVSFPDTKMELFSAQASEPLEIENLSLVIASLMS